jgi:hypothetical protein
VNRSSCFGHLVKGPWLAAKIGSNWDMPTVLGRAGDGGGLLDAVDGNFKVLAGMIGTMKERRAVGASSCGQLFIPARNQGSSTTDKGFAVSASEACDSVASRHGI